MKARNLRLGGAARRSPGAISTTFVLVIAATVDVQLYRHTTPRDDVPRVVVKVDNRRSKRLAVET